MAVGLHDRIEYVLQMIYTPPPSIMPTTISADIIHYHIIPYLLAHDSVAALVSADVKAPIVDTRCQYRQPHGLVNNNPVGIDAWFHNGKIHRGGDLPAVHVHSFVKQYTTDEFLMLQRSPLCHYMWEILSNTGSKHWFRHGKHHRFDENGEHLPAIVSAIETSWYVDGIKHRIGGPADIHRHVHEWWQHGQLHNEDGPAIDCIREGDDISDKSWYIRGELIMDTRRPWPEIAAAIKSGRIK